MNIIITKKTKIVKSLIDKTNNYEIVIINTNKIKIIIIVITLMLIIIKYLIR